FQLWLGASAADLGWPWPLANLSSFVEPFDTYADMSHLLARERWPDGEEPKSVAYFCSVLPPGALPAAASGPDHAAACRAAVRNNAVEFLRRFGGHLWPRAVDAATGEFRWDLLSGAGPRTGVERFDSQFWRANVDPSEQYVLSLPGTGRYRIKPDETGFANLVIAGD